MSMKSEIRRDSYGNITVHMKGGLDYEYSIPLRDELNRLAKQYPESSITIDMAGLDFVGSSGIAHFVETIKIIHTHKRGEVNLSNVNHEFKKVFKLFNLQNYDLFEDDFEMDNDETHHMNTTFGNRKRTFEN
jgi:anti-sigma B factor antagonist